MYINSNYDKIIYNNTKEKGVSMFILKAIAIGSITGLTASIPLGPAGMESIKRSLDKGFFSGFQVSFGAILADYVYIFLIHFGLASLLKMNKHVEGMFWIISGVLLFLFNRLSKLSSEDSSKVRRINLNKIPGILNGFSITFFNPSTPSIWLALSGTIMSIWASHGPIYYYSALGAMFVTTIIWFVLLNLLAARGLKKFSNENLTNNASKIIYYVLLVLSVLFIISGILKFFMWG